LTGKSGQIVWFTGLSGSGKSTLCNALAEELRRQRRNVQILDGDELRQGLCCNLGFSLSDRAENVRRIAHVARLLSLGGTTVLIAVISPFQTFRDTARSILPDMLEVFVDAPLATCEMRDPKGNYKKARAGMLKNFTGIDSPYETPSAPDVICRTDQETIALSMSKVLGSLSTSKNPTPLQPPAATDRRSTIAVDFDGVIANYEGWKGERVLGAPRNDVISALTQLKAEGWKIIVHTTRGASDIRAYLTDARVPFDEINENSDYSNRGHKPVARVYWDDRAVCYSGDAERDLGRIRAFRTWSGRT
jgi:adenylylsulfate kinase